MSSPKQRLLDQALPVLRKVKAKLPSAAQQKVNALRARAQEHDIEIPGVPAPAVSDRGLESFMNLLTGPDKNHRYDIQTAAIIAKAMGPNDLAIDIGCHEGAILDHMLLAAPSVSHLAFEPLPHLASALREKYPTIQLHEQALVADSTGPIEFHHVVSNPGYSGIRERRYDRAEEQVDIISVQTARLDDLVPDNCIPVVIKIDVEGAELGVLQGGHDTIARSKPLVIFEHGLGASDRYGTTPGDIFDFFSECDMGVSLLGTWLEDGPALSREQLEEQFSQGHNYYFIAHA